MAETVKRHDFVELEYTGKLADGTVFDTTDEKIAKRSMLLLPTENRTFAPAVICVGERQLLPGLDEQLAGKEVGKEYTVPIPTEKAFGKRDVKKMKIIPASTFREHKMSPHPGVQINVDGELGTVTRVAGGRVIVNFNHPLAGKDVVYTFTVRRKIIDISEQITSFVHSTLRIPQGQMSVQIVEGKAIVELPLPLPGEFSELLGTKLTELTGLKSVEFKGKEGKEYEH